ncbi:hypothetical protein B0H16DRAFT_520823 [Mycena metata]|uniref:Uncharacterized protein n=1 Tax=Mycena metata TaxID=1033252 RepID=A0AAD7H7Y4_9AGAR|nr:hypothetical protein B0H16DRAFT_520823 [Mycena metata]
MLNWDSKMHNSPTSTLVSHNSTSVSHKRPDSDSINISSEQAIFCDRFPEGRLCRLVNRHTGTLLDIRPALNIVSNEVPSVVGNEESAGVQYWIITPYGNGQAIIPVPKDGSSTLVYLTPSSVIPLESEVTVSPFPASWNILPTSKSLSPNVSPIKSTTVPKGLYEEWTCQISWPHFTEVRMLDLYCGYVAAETKVVSWTITNSVWQFWRIQFFRYNSGRCRSK